MVRVFPLVVVLLIGLSVATKTPMRPPDHVRDRDLPPAARKRVMALRAELANILTVSCKRLLYVLQEMEWARKCIYGGLPFPEYERVRAVCKNRSESLDALRAYRMRCNADSSRCDSAEYDSLFKARTTAVAACKRIGWDGEKNCPDLMALKDEFERTKGACRDNAGRVREIREEISAVKGNFARPSVVPRARVVM